MKVVKIVTHHDMPEGAAELWAREDVVAIGWGRVGDLRGKGSEEIKELLGKKYKESEGQAAKSAGTLIRFRDEIEPGDFVIAYKCSNKVALVGQITGEYQYEMGNDVAYVGGETEYCNQRKAQWRDRPRNFHRRFLPDDLPEKVALRGTIAIFECNGKKLEEALRRIPKNAD